MSIHVVYTRVGRLEWNPAKSSQNFQKHGYKFDICEQFFSGDLNEKIDNKQNYGEERLIATGTVEATVLTVVYTLRNEGRRIISVRRASRNERKKYFKRKTQENT